MNYYPNKPTLEENLGVTSERKDEIVNKMSEAFKRCREMSGEDTPNWLSDTFVPAFAEDIHTPEEAFLVGILFAQVVDGYDL